MLTYLKLSPLSACWLLGNPLRILHWLNSRPISSFQALGILPPYSCFPEPLGIHLIFLSTDYHLLHFLKNVTHDRLDTISWPMVHPKPFFFFFLKKGSWTSCVGRKMLSINGVSFHHGDMSSTFKICQQIDSSPPRWSRIIALT